MSSQAVVAEQQLVRAPRLPALAGAGVMSGAMLATGVLAYAFHILAARSLGPEGYGQIAVLWAALFLAAVVLFRPLEQTLARSLADRLARGEETRTVVRSVLQVFVAILLALALLAVPAWGPITDRLFVGSDVMTAMLIGGVAAYGVSYVIRGLLGGTSWFRGYALLLVADGVWRMVLAAPLVFVSSREVAAAAVLGAGLLGAIAPLFSGLRGLGGLVEHRRHEEPFHVGAALAFAGPASVMAAADQVLLNGGPLLVVLAGGAGATKAAGIVFAATMLIRVPGFLFQGVTASLLPNLTRLHAADKAPALERAVLRVAGVLVGAGLALAVGAALIGPQVMELLYGAGFEVGRMELALLAVGVGCYLASGTFSPGLLALDSGRRAAAAWAVAATLFVALYLLLPGGELERISIAFTVASIVNVLLLAVGLRTRVARRRSYTPESRPVS
jgi:O-antigen/teichoic acid export membrane protein